MSIITISDFKGQTAIAQTSNLGVRENLQSFIDKYEPKFLRSLLGIDLYKNFIDGLLLVPIPEKWVELRDETDLKQMIVNYVYYWYIRNQTTTTAGTGETKTKNENSYPVNSLDKQAFAWNEMANMARFFDLDTSVYPEFHRVYWRRYSFWRRGCGISEIFYNINANNI